MDDNKLIRNGIETIVSDAEMRDFYKGFLDGNLTLIHQRNEYIKKQKKEIFQLKKYKTLLGRYFDTDMDQDDLWREYQNLNSEQEKI